MKRRKFEGRREKLEKVQPKQGAIIKSALACILLSVLFSSFAVSSEKWPGVDESVVEKYAKEHGREARAPFINTDQGDLLLFVFLLAGTVGGFVAGYYWRMLMNEKPGKIKKDEDKPLLHKEN